MPRDDTFHLRYMLEAAQISLSFAESRTRDSLDDDLLFLYALVKAVEIIGEAASHLTEDFSPNIQRLNGGTSSVCETAWFTFITILTMTCCGARCKMMFRP